jgi:hypothetical protein
MEDPVWYFADSVFMAAFSVSMATSASMRRTIPWLTCSDFGRASHHFHAS